jgi:FkbM family methyltransferase
MESAATQRSGSRVVDAIGRIMRSIPSVPGKRTFARKVLAPFVRGREHAAFVSLKAAGGGELICHLDDWIPWNVYIHGCYARESHCERAMIELLRPGQTVFDVGANIGYYTVQFGCTVHPDGQVHAFEPVAGTSQTLRRNVELNKLENVKVNQLIASSDSQDQEIHISDVSTGNCSVETGTGPTELVGSITLDSYCVQKGIERIDLIKIDVEGHELHVLNGMVTLLSTGRVDHVFVEMNSHALSHANTTNAEVTEFLQQFGYVATSIATGREYAYSPDSDESLVRFSRQSCSARAVA